MKSRILSFLILGITILCLFIGVLIWQKNLNAIPKYNNQSFSVPISSKYIPTQSDLIFHWKINPTKLPQYLESYQDKKNKNITQKKISSIRDTFFKLIGIDFKKDISTWVGEYGSFAVFESNKENLDNWLMVLEIKKDLNTSQELESILGAEVIIRNNSKINASEIIESRIMSTAINKDTSIYFLKDKEQILISSSPKIIKSSISNLENNSLTEKEKYKNFQLKSNLNDGVLLLEMNPNKIFNILGKQENVLDLDLTSKLISSINITNNELVMEGILFYDKNNYSIEDKNNSLIKNNIKFNKFENYIIVDSPQQFYRKESIHPYQKLIKSIIKKSTSSDYSYLLKTIMENTEDNFVWIKDKDWLILTKKSEENKNRISSILKQRNFLNHKIELNKKNLEIWSKITTNNVGDPELKENIEAIIEENKKTYIWSKNISSISKFEDENFFPNNADYKEKIDESKDFIDVIQVHLGKVKAKEFLIDFYPYILLNTMLSNKLDFPNNIDISIDSPTINHPDFIKFKINLKKS